MKINVDVLCRNCDPTVLVKVRPEVFETVSHACGGRQEGHPKYHFS